MLIATATLHEADNPDAADVLADQIVGRLGTLPVDLCVMFATAHFDDALERIVAGLHEQLNPRNFIGCTGESVICDAYEYERQPVICVWAARMPDVKIHSFHLSRENLTQLKQPEDWREQIGATPEERPSFILLSDPFSFNLLEMLDKLSNAYGDGTATGGVASAGEAPGQNSFFFEGQVLHHGLCGAALSGNIAIDAVVSQGCRPIGKHLIVTEAERNIIRELGGKPPLTMLLETLQQCSPRDIELARSGGLLIGRVINEYQNKFERGDFLIRNAIGFEHSSGAMAINDTIRAGQTIQFHVRDREAADDDLASMLAAAPREHAAGALLFTCSGRGSRMFKRRHHDARAVSEAGGAIPVAGMFCAGEVGPVRRHNFLHGFTASAAFFSPAHVTAEK